MRFVPPFVRRPIGYPGRLFVMALAAAVPAACTTTVPKPAGNPFIGTWSTPDRHQIAFRNDTVVLNPPGEPPTPMSAATCDGQFRFGYSRWNRDVLIGLAARQPELASELSRELVQPEYQIASVSCGEGGTTYVLLDERDVLAIHNDRDIGAVEKLTRL